MCEICRQSMLLGVMAIGATTPWWRRIGQALRGWWTRPRPEYATRRVVRFPQSELIRAMFLREDLVR